jgi:hypothetical protein
VLLMHNDYYCHVRGVEIIEMAWTNDVAIVCITPHLTHKMQPLDLS